MSKNYYKTEDAPANSTGTAVAGTGADGTVVKKKRKKKEWDLYSPDALGRQFRMVQEDVALASPETNTTPDSQFAGVDVFNVGADDYNNCKFGKKKHARWDNYVDVDSEAGKRIYGYAKKNPMKSIIVQHDKTGHMLYLKKFEKGEEQ
jgi:hypothetical protein